MLFPLFILSFLFYLFILLLLFFNTFVFVFADTICGIRGGDGGVGMWTKCYKNKQKRVLNAHCISLYLFKGINLSGKKETLESFYFEKGVLQEVLESKKSECSGPEC